MEHKSSETKLSVLVVDDCESIRGLLETLLSRNGHRCESAANGVEAMVKVTQSRFDVVITDIVMPKMDGITLTRKLTQDFSDLPVMVMTAQLDDDSAESAIMAGARDVIAKPFEISEFMVRLHKMVDIQNLHGEQRV
jgi:two-component system response regulator MprA